MTTLPAPPADRARPDDAARRRWGQRLRTTRIVYAVALAAFAAVLATVFGVLVGTGSAAHATLHTVNAAPADLPLRAASATQTRAWSTTDRAAQGSPQWQGTVVTWSAQTLRGRNARTGAETWSYTRSDRTICAAAQLGGVALAIFRRDGDCDEMDGFDAGTGARKWTRTLDFDRQPVNGTPTFEFSDATVLVSTSSVVYALSPSDGGTRWTYSRYGCRIEQTRLGTTGVLISQTCGSAEKCAGVEKCGHGQQLLLRDPTAGKLDTDKDNFDQVKWNLIGYAGVPVSADTLLAAGQPDSNVLDELDPADGAVRHRAELAPAPADLDAVVTEGTDTGALIWVDGHAYLTTSGSDRVSWVATTSGAPTVTDSDAIGLPQLSASRITAPVAGRVATLSARTGGIAATYAVPAPAGSRVYPLGSGFLVASPSGVSVSR